ncbi:MAG TPA: PAS domain S-box protein, partial [Candidatus Obscuribacterales bacterium]
LETTLEKLQETAERLNIALSAAEMGSWDWNLDHQVLYCSPQTQAILGLENASETTANQTWRDRIHPEDWPQVEAAIAHAQATQTPFSEEYRICLPNHSVRWVLSQGRFVFEADGQAHRMIGVLQDTTQDKRASLALATSEAKFRAVFEQAAVGMARLSVAGQWLEVNETFCTLLGYTAPEIIGRHFREFTEAADMTQDEHYYQQLLQGEVTSCRFEKRYRHRDGTPIWTMVTVSTERDEDDRLISLIAVIEDIRNLKQTRSELERRAGELERVNGLLAITNAMLDKRNSELDQFAYVASHDLKAPLRAIANLSEWIEEDLGNEIPPENKQQLALLRNRVQRLEALINGLLEYSRVGRQEQKIEPVDVHQMLAEAIELLDPPDTFTVAIATPLPTLQTNRTALNQVFSNLIGNAIKHHDRPDGHVTITAQEYGNLIEFAVQDDGPGIAPEYHDKVFTIFQTLKSRDEFESTGIGLSLVKKIIESEGGSVSLESALGEGATFRFTWPRH